MDATTENRFIVQRAAAAGDVRYLNFIMMTRVTHGISSSGSKTTSLDEHGKKQTTFGRKDSVFKAPECRLDRDPTQACVNYFTM